MINIKKRTHEEYLIEVSIKNPHIEVLGRYINNNTNILHRCSCGNEWMVQPSCILSGAKCIKCRGGERLTYNDVSLFINSLDFNLLDTEFINITSKINIQDKDGFLYVTNVRNLKANELPDKFNKSNPYTIQNIKLWLKLNKKPFELISDTYNGNNKKLTWKCLKEGCNEIFQANWGHIYSNKGCGFCKGFQVGQSNSFATKYPDLVSEWNTIKNGDLTPYNTSANSNKEIWWVCKKGHEWKSSPNTRGKGGCPYCGNKMICEDNCFQNTHPQLLSEWNYNRNINITPEDVVAGSSKKVWWICKHGHEWESSLTNRTSKNLGCPYCSGHKVCIDNCLATKIPELSKEWNYDKNGTLTPFDITCGSNKKVWWKCSFNPLHEWNSKVSNRVCNNRGCPHCAKSIVEKSIYKYLVDLNISHTWGYVIPQCKNKKVLPFDFAIFDDKSKTNLKFILEYDGEFHYEPARYSKDKDKMLKKLKDTQRNDKIKDQYCLDNDIKLVRIPYWEKENIKSIIDEQLIYKL